MTENLKTRFGQDPLASDAEESVLASVSRVIDTMRLSPDDEEKLRNAKAEAARQWEAIGNPELTNALEPAAKHTAAEKTHQEPEAEHTAAEEAHQELEAEHTAAEEAYQEPAVDVRNPEEPEVDEEPEAAEKPEQSLARPNVVKFGLQPVLPYAIEEAVNRLRINISFLGSDVKKIMVVSSEPNEGKSFVALNLWKQMAMAGESTVLLDLDMRKSTMAVKYQLYREDGQELQGSSHYLSGDTPIEDMILHTDMPTGDLLPNVDNIVNPSMLFESRKFTEMMTFAQDNYRYIFVDVPPLGLVSDGELIGSVCDGAVLCVRGGVTSRGIVRHSIQQLERAGCPLLGIVLNRVGGSGSGYYHKYYGKKYYYKDQYYSK